jgi:hypothetical protein
MHEALCRPSGTTLDTVYAERRAAVHSANIGSMGDRGFESISLQRAVRCEPDFGANPIDDRRDFTWA